MGGLGIRGGLGPGLGLASGRWRQGIPPFPPCELVPGPGGGSCSRVTPSAVRIQNRKSPVFRFLTVGTMSPGKSQVVGA